MHALISNFAANALSLFRLLCFKKANLNAAKQKLNALSNDVTGEAACLTWK